jgi:hypothetical protein
MGESSRAPTDTQVLDRVSLQSKQFFSAGASFSTLACAAIVAKVWGFLGHLYTPFTNELFALAISFMLVFAYAFVVPEPLGSENAGRLRLTLPEMIFGFVNSIIVCSTAVGLTVALK